MPQTPLESLIDCGTRLWLDSVDPDLVRENLSFGVTGATSNPIIITDLLRSGRFDDQIAELLGQDLSDEDVAWAMTDRLVLEAQDAFRDIWERSRGNDGYVSFELDPLLEEENCPLDIEERAERYVELGLKWTKPDSNRMIKVPATPAGLQAVEDLVTAGVPVNVTLIFSKRQYQAARDAVWRGAQRRTTLADFKSVFSIFVSRVDVYTEKHVSELSPAAQGLVGIVNAQRIFLDNQQFWKERELPLQQEIVFASTGTKKPSDPADKYVAALAGEGIQTNPPATNAAIQQMLERTFTKQVGQLPEKQILNEIDRLVDMTHLEETLMAEGLRKFAEPQRTLLDLIAGKRSVLATT